MEPDKETICDSNNNSNYHLNSKKTKEKSKVIKYMGKGLKIILYIFIITTTIFIITKNSLSQIRKRIEINDRYFNLKKISNNEKQQLNQIKQMLLRIENELSINNQSQQLSLNKIKQIVLNINNKISII